MPSCPPTPEVVLLEELLEVLLELEVVPPPPGPPPPALSSASMTTWLEQAITAVRLETVSTKGERRSRFRRRVTATVFASLVPPPNPRDGTRKRQAAVPS